MSKTKKRNSNEPLILENRIETPNPETDGDRFNFLHFDEEDEMLHKKAKGSIDSKDSTKATIIHFYVLLPPIYSFFFFFI